MDKIKKLRILGLLACLICLTIIFDKLLILNSIPSKDTEFTENKLLELKQNRIWKISQIHIDNNIPSINWATTSANFNWCNGSGTWTDPYLIENVVIDCQERESGILIENSNVYFIIKNCTFYNSGDEGKYSEEAGIKLVYTNNGTLINNNCSFNEYGIRLINSINNTLSSNIINNNKVNGINLYDGSNNTIIENEICNCYEDGIIVLSGSSYNNISLNDLHNNFGSGLYLDGDYNIISSNDIVKNKEYGIHLFTALYNTVTNNKMKKCGLGISDFEFISTNEIDTLNTVNGKTVYFYFNQTGLDKYDYLIEGPPGQIMLLQCNNSKISNFNLSQTSVGLFLSQCKNVTISNNIMNNCTKFGICLSFCDNNTIYNNSLDYNTIGIELLNCYNTIVKKNNATYNNLDGILLLESYFNIIHANNASFNLEIGIHAESCENNNITENFVCNNINTNYLNYGIGIQIGETGSYEGSDNNTITKNIIGNNSYAGLFLNGKNNTITKNNLTNCGLVFGYYSGQTTIEDFSSQTIDKSNLVNNKTLYYYFNSTNLNFDNFSKAGQIILVRCNDSIVSNVQLSQTNLAISSYYGNNITISKNNVTENSYSGIYLIQNSNSNVSHNTLKANINNYLEVSTFYQFGFGLYLEDCHNCNFTMNNASSNGFGIYLKDSNNILLKSNILYDNAIAGICILANQPGKCDHNNLSANIMRNCGVYIYETPYLQNTDLYIDKTNLVNDKPLHYYSNINSLNSNDFVNPGQIILFNCNNSVISNFNFSKCTVGISLFYCHNTTIYNVDSSENSIYGFMLVFSNNCNLFNNTASKTIFGIYSVFCSNNSYTRNIVKNINPVITNEMYFGAGISCMWYNEALTIVGNTIENCSNGIMIYLQMPGFFHNISDNIIEKNNQYGIWLLDCHNSTFIKNIIQNNGIGIFFDGESKNNNNSFYYNSFLGNSVNAQDNGKNNVWDDGFAGNFWEDYDGIDANNDGIGDTLYSIQGFAYNKDNFPLIYMPNLDTDGDGLINYEEYILGKDNYRTNVTNPDSDYDELSDFWEWKYSTNPWNSDTDSDRMPDAWEVFNLLNPIDSADSTIDTDNDFLLNMYEYLNSTDPNIDDTDGDTFLDGIEAGAIYDWRTDPLNRWWYPMPNLVAVDFQIASAERGKPFTLNITIKNDGIWEVENITIIIWAEYLHSALYNSTIDEVDPINLDVDEVFQDIIQIKRVKTEGRLVMELQLDPKNSINETYSNKDGSYRYREGEDDNTRETILDITGGNGKLNLDLIIIIVIGAVAFAGTISTYAVIRPRIKKRADFKKKIENAKKEFDNFEFNMRSFIKTKLTDVYESSWWDAGIPEYIRRSIGMKMSTEKPKKLGIQIDRMEFLDLTHYTSIITSQDNWEKIFSKIFPNRSDIETNFENLRLIKRDLNEGIITREQLSSYPLYIHAIRNHFSKGFNVFLSYSTIDTDHFNIKEVAKRLEAFPRIDRVFYWEEDSGENIVTYMEKTLKITKVFVFFCSEHSIKSKAVEDEWQAAFQMRKKGLMKIVPVYENEDIIPFLLMPLLNVKYTKDDLDGFIQKLYEEIMR